MAMIKVAKMCMLKCMCRFPRIELQTNSTWGGESKEDSEDGLDIHRNEWTYPLYWRVLQFKELEEEKQ